MIRSILFLVLLITLTITTACGEAEEKPATNATPGNSSSTEPDAGSDGGETDAGCAIDEDCELGTVCTVDGTCTAVACEFCTEDQECLVTDDNPDGTCSADGSIPPMEGNPCDLDEDCELGAVCGSDNTCVVATCEFCTAGQICYRTPALPNGSCSAPECTTEADCEEAEACVQGQCE